MNGGAYYNAEIGDTAALFAFPWIRFFRRPPFVRNRREENRSDMAIPEFCPRCGCPDLVDEVVADAVYDEDDDLVVEPETILVCGGCELPYVEWEGEQAVRKRIGV